MERNISLDQTALSPEEHKHYQPFINHFKQHTQNRGGKLRFAEAAHFLRKYYPFQTELEDEIRSFFPQEIQLGKIDLGCVLAILRLLSHLMMAHQPLHRDLIFIQTEPLPTLIPQQHQQQSSSNPFLRTKSNENRNETHPLAPKTSLSADDITKHSNSNPFKQRSVSANPNQANKTNENIIPRIPPRPAKPVPIHTTHPSDKSPLEALPPPKHYSQRLKEEKDVDDQQYQQPPVLQVDLPPLWKNQPKPKINNRPHQKLADKSPCPPYSNGAWPIDPQPFPPKASDHTNKTAIPPPLPTKPARTQAQEDDDDGVGEVHKMGTLTRSQTLNHPPRRTAPAVPPPRRRPDSLHIHNPHAVPLDELVASAEPENGRLSGGGGGGGGAKGRTVSHEHSAGPQDHLAETDRQLEGQTTTKNERRSVSLFFDPKPPQPPQQQHPVLPHLSHLKSLELGLRNDGKDLLNDVAHGWRARHGIKDERIPLVHHPVPDHHHLIHLRNPQLSHNLSNPHCHSPPTDHCHLGWSKLD